MGIPDHLTCLLRNLYAGQEATELDMEQWTGSNWERSVRAVYCHPAYLTYMQSTSCGILSWMNHNLESRLPGEISTSDMQWHPTPVLWPPHMKSWLIGKDSDAGRDWGQEEKGTTEDEMAGWHQWLNGCESECSWSWWWTGRPGVLRFMGSQRVGHDWVN